MRALISKQDLTMTFVMRLSHWPVSLAFSQWLEYTQRCRQLKQLYNQVAEKHRSISVTMAFKFWRTQLANNKKAVALRVCIIII
jgi:hypothetical protein